MNCVVNSAFVPPRCASEFNQWRLLRGRCRGSSSVCTRRCWTAVSSLHLSGCPYCVNGPGWPDAWMAFSLPMTPQHCPGPARCQSDGSRVAGSQGWGSRGQIFASSPSERPWCSAGCHSAVGQGKALHCFQSQEHQNMQRFKQRAWLGQPFWSCGAESPSLCGECPGIRGFAYWGQSQCLPTFKGKPHVHRLKDNRWI